MSGQDLAALKREFSAAAAATAAAAAAEAISDVSWWFMAFRWPPLGVALLSSNSLWKMGRISTESTAGMLWLDL